MVTSSVRALTARVVFPDPSLLGRRDGWTRRLGDGRDDFDGSVRERFVGVRPPAPENVVSWRAAFGHVRQPLQCGRGATLAHGFVPR